MVVSSKNIEIDNNFPRDEQSFSNELIICPHCRQPLTILEGKNYCSTCSAPFLYNDGIFDFLPGQDFYWGEIDQPKMRKVIEQAREENWYSVISRICPEKLGYIVDPGRMGWLFHCYDPQADQVCLDIGSGWGSLTFYLKDFYKTVFSLDGVLDRLQFQTLRAATDNVDNIHFLRSNFKSIPLPDNTVDLVVLNGVLEWVALRDLHTKPDEIQQDFLVEVRRVLKREGILYLGIENRFGVQYFLGARDHGGYRFTSLLPRATANLLVKIYCQKNTHNADQMHVFSDFASAYRTYTYSKWGYRKLLHRAGFSNTSIYWTWPGYSYPRMSGPLDGKSVRYVLDNLINRHRNPMIRFFAKFGWLVPELLLKGIIQLFSPYFLIFAGTKPFERTNQASVLRSESDYKSFVRTSLGSNPSIKTTYLLLDRDGISKSVNIQINNSPSNHKNLLSIQESTGIKGHTLRVYRRNEVIAAAEWLADYQHRTASDLWSFGFLNNEITALISSVKDDLNSTHIFGELELFEQNYLERISTVKLPIATEHGDFTPTNILVGPDNKIQIIDWEHTQVCGNPLLDIGAFTLSLLRYSAENGSFPTKIKPRHPFIWFCRHFENQFRIPVSLAPTYYLLRVIHRLAGEEPITPGKKYIMHTWCSLLPPALEFSNNVEVGDY